MSLLRRKFLHFLAGAAATPAIPHLAWAEVPTTASQNVRVATGLLAMWQSTAWLGAEAGVFKKRGIDLTLPAIAVGGPEAAAGLIRGDWEFAHTGAVPVAEEFLKGHDVVILATPTSDFPKSFVMTRKGNQRTCPACREKGWGADRDRTDERGDADHDRKGGCHCDLFAAGEIDQIYAALADGEIDAGALPIDLRFSGEALHGWNAFPIDAFDAPSIFATTRKLIASNRPLVMNVMQGFVVKTIHLFKTQPDIVVPLLQRYVKIEDRKAAEDLYAYHVPVFQDSHGRPLREMQTLREFLERSTQPPRH